MSATSLHFELQKTMVIWSHWLLNYLDLLYGVQRSYAWCDRFPRITGYSITDEYQLPEKTNEINVNLWSTRITPSPPLQIPFVDTHSISGLYKTPLPSAKIHRPIRHCCWFCNMSDDLFKIIRHGVSCCAQHSLMLPFWRPLEGSRIAARW